MFTFLVLSKLFDKFEEMSKIFEDSANVFRDI